VASRLAADVQATLAPGCTQWDRDQRYLYAFFGKDFIDELTQLDSEFLKTGNKLLSLNSMDSTSLSSALFLMALAKNEVRTEIIQVFLATVQRDLPEAEWKYYVAGVTQPKHCDACKDKKEYLLAFNSQFQSFIGFFTAQVTGNDTLNPLQREFIKLAQIFKAQMITEMQLRQRVMERSLLEERINVNYLDELRKAKAMEDEAKAELRKLQNLLPNAILDSRNAVSKMESSIKIVEDQLAGINQLLKELDNPPELKFAVPRGNQKPNIEYRAEPQYGVIGNQKVELPTWVVKRDAEGKATWYTDFSTATEFRNQLVKLLEFLDQFQYSGKSKEASDRIQAALRKLTSGPTETQRLPWGDEDAGEYSAFGELFDDLTYIEYQITKQTNIFRAQIRDVLGQLERDPAEIAKAMATYQAIKDAVAEQLNPRGTFAAKLNTLFAGAQPSFDALRGYQVALKRARDARRPLDEKKLLDLLVDEMEDKYVEILESMRAHTSNVDNYLKSVTTALDDDFNTQYYLPSFRRAREASRYWDVTLSQIETTTVLANNRSLGKVSPAATFEFDLPKRDILITEGFRSAKALFDEYGALMNDPSFLALAKLYSGNPVSMMQSGGAGLSSVRNVLPGLPTSPDEKILAQQGPGQKQFGTALDALIPDPAIYKFETGTGYEVRPVLSPDGQAVVFGFDYMYTTDVREPVRADEKHLGRVKRHFVHTDVQLGNFELREVSKYMVSLKVARTGKGVQLLQDIPGVGVLFRPLPSAGASLQQNLIYSQATIFPTLFDLMGLRYAPAVADLDPLADRMAEFAARYRRLDVEQRIYDIGATRVDDALRTPYGERRYDFYRPQVSLPFVHPNGYTGLGLRLYDGSLREGYNPNDMFPDTRFAPGISLEGRSKPINLNPPPGFPGYELPPGFNPEFAAPPAGTPAHPLHDPRLAPTGPRPVTPGALNNAPNAVRVPGMGSVGFGRQVPIDPKLSTTPPPLSRPMEMPTSGQQTTVTPNRPGLPQPSSPMPLPPVRPQPVGLAPV
ncbi:MAG TPA: hypothetical protein VGE74_10535, partial [Gemmata sp.]